MNVVVSNTLLSNTHTHVYTCTYNYYMYVYILYNTCSYSLYQPTLYMYRHTINVHVQWNPLIRNEQDTL